MVVLQLVVDGKLEGHIPLKVGTSLALQVADVPEPPKSDPLVTPCACGSGRSFADCHGGAVEAEQASPRERLPHAEAEKLVTALIAAGQELAMKVKEAT